MTRQTQSAGPSKKLLAAQERLLALRAEQAQPAKRPFSLFRTAENEPLSVEEAFSSSRTAENDPSSVAQAFSLFSDERKPGSRGVDSDYEYAHEYDWDRDRERDKGEVKLHASLGLGMLRRKKVASGRLWLLMRALDKNGRGWLALAEIRRAFSGPQAFLPLCSPRHLRNLLDQGEGIFWQRESDRLWLRSVPRTAAALGVERLDGRPVALPLSALTASIGQVRAHLYAAFHSARKNPQPISRAALRRLSRVSPRSQQNYEKRARVRKQKNYATGPKIQSARAQELAWGLGSACFPWRDHQGIHGSTAATYIAWQLPNSYVGPHEQRPNGNRKRFNQQLADLSDKGMTGNDQPTVECRARRYFANARTAAQNPRSSEPLRYWPAARPGIWYVINGTKER